ncbi:magnesium transport protein CorA [Acetobacter cibinongensis]|uniref:Magnesium transport protein CorA n=1 Tax=Acetobacter cibinongensis TaxID=146475 RepID=A0A0D6N6H8_9PROT|nr:CorA family divalent cation transporter [Acetobacter cibinongensis]GAN61106.1 magnesium/cobalt transporter CorA [Acetobacter cibinongensis]GBQ12691.1 magnesium/cobalt transporter CorA [Acetobacter cibinongensis NRIC 0482]GEL58398.1 magnesium transport protein CorA [Acetobacter cibinongensis]
MFLAHKPGAPARAIESEADAQDVTWIDLLNPTPQEQALAGRICGQPLPTLDDLSEIESSSRISVRNGAAFLSTPLLKKIGPEFQSSPVGFILTADRLITIRYQPYPSFEAVAQLVAEHTLPPAPASTPAPSTVIGPAQDAAHPDQKSPQTAAAPPQRLKPAPIGAGEILVALIETIVDRLADILENVGLLLDKLSQDIFKRRQNKSPMHSIAAWQRDLLERVGSAGDLCSRVRDALLGLERITIFLGESKKDGAAPASGLPLSARRFEAGVSSLSTENAPYALSGALRGRMTTANRDLSSLTDYVSQAASKVEFLLDATLGFISIEQNGMMKVLTVVSFIGVAPTLIAGVYGMNFKDIPELEWRYGYWYSLALMTASVVLPLLWFWRKGWLGGIK